MTTITQDFASVIAAVNATNGVVQDDHRGAGERTVAGIALLVSGDKARAVPLLKSRYFSLNLLYLESNNVPHISTSSIGGCVEIFDLTMEEAIAQYNESQTNNLFCASFLTNIHFLVDGKLEPVDLVSEEKLEEFRTTVKTKREAWEARDKA